MIHISTDPALLDIQVIYHFLSNNSYWAKNIPMDVVERAIENSLCFGVYDGDDQVGFARVITDHATFAYLADVFIVPAYRGRGLSKKMVSAILEHPSLQGLRRWMLGTADAHGLYEQFGFKPLARPERFLEISRPDIYNK
ncbi:GNAT family N-acetyltransferase [Arcticibacter sp. MXS-1]|uniref:GNAT family N-acetyltransferase n=1 Tax=Arcticibacter sp. MXS-1 TaxID=3341726 RepID=UPI0035A92B98